MFGTDKATVSEVTLTKIRFGIQDMVSGSFLRDMEYSEQWDLSNDALIRRLRFYLLGNETHEERYNEDVRTYPVNLWDEFKWQWFPPWLLKHFPIRWFTEVRKVTAKHYHVCPHLNMPEQRDHIRFMIRDESYI